MAYTLQGENGEHIADLPYTVVGVSGTPKPYHSILLTAKGVKALAEQMEDNDMVRISSWEDVSDECRNIKPYGKIELIKGKKK